MDYERLVAKFWEKVTDIKTQDLSEFKPIDLGGGTVSQAVVFLLLKNRLELLTTLNFYHRAALELVADDAVLLGRLLSILNEGHFGNGVPSYVWRATTEETRQVFKDWAKAKDCEWIIPAPESDEAGSEIVEAAAEDGSAAVGQKRGK